MVPRYPYSFDRVASVYDATRALPPGAEQAALTILRAVLRGQTTLEVGVGTGRWARLLQAQGLEVVGVDVSRSMISEGLRRGLRNAILADAGQLPFRDRTFDVSMTNHVLHLLPDWPGAVREICRVTRQRYLTIVQRLTETPDLEGEYQDAVGAAGVDTRRPGIPERELGSRLQPDDSASVGRFEETIPASTFIYHLRNRSQSSQWNVPEPLHERVMSEIERRHEGDAILRTLDIRVDAWSIDRMRTQIGAA